MKNIKVIVGSILIILAFVTMVCSVIASMVFSFQNPDMTELRHFIEYPQPSIACGIALIVLWVGQKIVLSDTGRKNKK